MESSSSSSLNNTSVPSSWRKTTKSSSSTVQAALLQAAQDLQMRGRVEDCVRDMVTDVELAAQLEAALKTQLIEKRLQQRVSQHEEALQEMVAVEHGRIGQNMSLADIFVKELWSLSTELGNYQIMQQKHEQLTLDYDEVLAKLMQAEEDLQAIKERGVPAREANVVVNETKRSETDAMASAEATATAAVAASESKDDLEKNSPLLTVAKEPPMEAQEKMPPVQEEKPNVEGGPSTVAPDSAEMGAAESVDEDKVVVGASAVPENATAVVALDDGIGSNNDDKPDLEVLDAEILMVIFGFLDALDILNVAQINISMYSRVDSLFGLGPPPENMMESNNSNNNEPTSAKEDVKEKEITAVTPNVLAETATQQQSPTTPVRTAGEKTPVFSESANNKQVTDDAPLLDTNAVGARGLFSMLRPSSSPSSSVTSPARKRPPPNSPASGEVQPMNAAMANSMASKLSDAELNAIILMTERLKQKEQLSAKLTKENEEMVARLNGTDAVKQFLITKVRDMELLMVKSEDNETKVAQQIASDQEVIAFLDGRVQELEREMRTRDKHVTSIEKELAAVKSQTEKRSTVMSDMLKFEREKLTDGEREWKATKKLLVKEIKSCRAHILSLQAERDGFREQNEVLRNAVLNSSTGGSRQLQHLDTNGATTNGHWRSRTLT